MIVNSRVVRGVLQIGVAAATLSVLASCSTVTYGTGVGTTAQTVQDLTGPLNILRRSDGINYAEPRPQELNTNTNGTLPPPVTTTDGGNTAAGPTVMTPTNTACGGDPGDPVPPSADCAPNPNAPVVVQNAGLLGGGANDTGIRTLADPCQWWQVRWDQMTPDEQQALGRLGWTGSNWGTGDPTLLPDTVGKTWNDLSRRERRAAESLGFNETSWNSCTLL